MADAPVAVTRHLKIFEARCRYVVTRSRPYPRPSLPDTRYSILNTLTPLLHLGQHVVLSLPSAPGKLPYPRLQTQYREQRIGGVDFAAFVGFEQGDGTFAGKEAGGVKTTRMGEYA